MTPGKYIPDERRIDDKQWLYEQYWGNLHPLSEIASDCDVAPETVRRRLKSFGIPLRNRNWDDPYDGFRPSDSDVNETDVNWAALA